MAFGGAMQGRCLAGRPQARTDEAGKIPRECEGRAFPLENAGPFGMSESIRLDKWLWAARFFKTRSLAAKACAGGRVKRSGIALKPAATVQLADVLEIPFADGPGARTIAVRELLVRRVAAALAEAAYDDLTPEAVHEARREALAAARSADRREGDQGRPTKRNRRAIQRIRGFFD